MSCILGVEVATSLDSRRTSATTAPGARQCSGFGGGRKKGKPGASLSGP